MGRTARGSTHFHEKKLGETEGKGVPGSPQAVERKKRAEEEEATVTVMGLGHPETQQDSGSPNVESITLFRDYKGKEH